MAAERPPRFALRLSRAFRAEWRKAVRQPSLYVYVLLVVLVAALWGPYQWSLEKEQEAKRVPKVTQTFGDEPLPEPPDLSERGANGFLVLAASYRAGAVVAALLLLLYASTLLAGERTAGTCRLLLTRPVTRWDVVLAKAGLLVALTLILTAAVALAGGLIGLGHGGYGDYVDVRHGLVNPNSEAGFLAGATAANLLLTPIGLVALAWLGLLISSLFRSAATAVTAATLAGLAGLALNLVLSPDAAKLNFLTYVGRYPAVVESLSRGLSDYRFEWNQALAEALVPAGSALVFLLGALIMFRYRDIHE